MSLVLTSNLDEKEQQNGINLPFQYHNYLSQPLELEPDSEVAVQSVKVVKTGNVTLDNFNNLFYSYVGTTTGNLSGTTSLPVPVELTEFGTKSSFNVDELATRIGEKLTSSLGNPMLVKSDLNTSGVVVEVERTASGDDKGGFEGYIFNITNASLSASLNDTKTTANFVDLLGLNVDYSGSWNSASATITKTEADKECDMIGTGMPLALTEGVFKLSFKEAGGEWEVGLSRWMDTNQLDYEDQTPPYVSPLERMLPFYDWVAKSVYDPSGNSGSGIYELRLYHTLYNEQDVVETEFEYWEVGPSSGSLTAPIEIFNNASDYGTEKISEIQFKVINEKMEVFIQSSNGSSASHTLANGSYNADGRQNLKPVSQNNRFMYPRVVVKDHNKKITIQKYNGVTPTNFDYQAQDYQYRRGKNENILKNKPVYDWYAYWGRRTNSGLYQFNARQIDTRYMMEVNASTDDPITYTQKGLNASGGLDTSFVLFLAETETGAGLTGLGNYTKGANAQEMLGFKDTPIIDSNIGTYTNNLFSFKSNSVPLTISRSSLFVRLDNFNCESNNGQMTGPSKILYHMPRFDNANNDVGGLFFEPHERTYLKLNNTHKLIINDFDISLCNANETLARNITGKTIVMLHFRKSR